MPSKNPAVTSSTSWSLAESKSTAFASEPLPETRNCRSSYESDPTPKRLASRRPQARSSPDVLWSGAGTIPSRPFSTANPAGRMICTPNSTSSSGKASTARRSWSVTMPLKMLSERLPVATEPKPIRTLGVPPILSSVQNAKPLSLAPIRAVVTRTHASACLDRAPTSNGSGCPTHMSAISSISLSLSAVVSLVSTSIAICPRASTVSLPYTQSSSPAAQTAERKPAPAFESVSHSTIAHPNVLMPPPTPTEQPF